jgi:hypothetical protein
MKYRKELSDTIFSSQELENMVVFMLKILNGCLLRSFSIAEFFNEETRHGINVKVLMNT